MASYCKSSTGISHLEALLLVMSYYGIDAAVAAELFYECWKRNRQEKRSQQTDNQKQAHTQNEKQDDKIK